jgi:hypothetical protein
VRSTDLAIDAFYTIFRAKVSGAGVVDEEGKLVGCLAAADLKQISESYDFTTLLKPVKDFLTDEVSKRQNMLFSSFLSFFFSLFFRLLSLWCCTRSTLLPTPSAKWCLITCTVSLSSVLAAIRKGEFKGCVFRFVFKCSQCGEHDGCPAGVPTRGREEGPGQEGKENFARR